jgi:methylated-DNA-[protein]-cysteine S-methyltransferase
MIRYATFETPLGTMFALAEDGFITRLDFLDAKYAKPLDPSWEESSRESPLRECIAQVRAYFDSGRREFDLPLKPRGTDFQQRVWKAIARVPSGKTITYAELATRAGAPGSARAAGAATGRNPIGIVVPCHRIVGTDGSLTGYAGGLARKTRLLEMEGVLQGSLV